MIGSSRYAGYCRTQAVTRELRSGDQHGSYSVLAVLRRARFSGREPMASLRRAALLLALSVIWLARFWSRGRTAGTSPRSQGSCSGSIFEFPTFGVLGLPRRRGSVSYGLVPRILGDPNPGNLHYRHSAIGRIRCSESGRHGAVSRRSGRQTRRATFFRCSSWRAYYPSMMISLRRISVCARLPAMIAFVGSLSALIIPCS